jgi:hypothetical protein
MAYATAEAAGGWRVSLPVVSLPPGWLPIMLKARLRAAYNHWYVLESQTVCFTALWMAENGFLENRFGVVFDQSIQPYQPL